MGLVTLANLLAFASGVCQCLYLRGGGVSIMGGSEDYGQGRGVTCCFDLFKSTEEST